jgi:hypothetical protein
MLIINYKIAQFSIYPMRKYLVAISGWRPPAKITPLADALARISAAVTPSGQYTAVMALAAISLF